MFPRRKTTSFYLGNVGIGQAYPVSIQSMTNTDTRNVPETLKQIRALTTAGCEIVRVAVPDQEAAQSLGKICTSSPVPVVADIHFDYRLALMAIQAGVQGLRINPGNIGNEARIREVVLAARQADIPIRVGVNSGSVEKDMLVRYGGVNVDSLVESALKHVHILESIGFEKIKISIKASHVPLMIAAYREIATRVEYPLHLGVTEAGSLRSGVVKSAVGIGTLLAEGIGDTIRVSLTGDPVQEIPVAKEILRSLGLRKEGVEIISCPTCGRCQVDLAAIVAQVEEATKEIQEHITVAIMGCVVNGPGEARGADLGIAGGRGEALLFRKGEILGKVPEDQLITALLAEIEKMRGESS